MTWFMHACPVCGGDLHDDPFERGWLECLMCARSFPAKREPVGGAARRTYRAQGWHTKSAPARAHRAGVAPSQAQAA
jgi:hypothetical protein